MSSYTTAVGFLRRSVLSKQGMRLGVFSVLLVAGQIALATTWNVNTNSDVLSDDGQSGRPTSLRYAMTHATSGDTINFSNSYFATTLGCTSAPSVPCTIALLTPLPAITNKTLTVSGLPHDSSTLLPKIAINGNGSHQIFNVSGSGSETFNLSNLTLRDGNIQDTTGGGGVYLANLATVNIELVWFDGNTYEDANSSGGGAIDAESTVDALLVDRCVFTGNTYDGFGGVPRAGTIYSAADTLTITESIFNSNGDPFLAYGGVFVDAGTSTVTLRDSSFYGNYAGGGAALWLQGGAAVAIENTTFVANGNGDGSAIYDDGGAGNPSLTLTHVTIVGNVGFQSVWLDSTVALTLKDSLIANNDNTTGVDIFTNGTAITSGGYNLVQALPMGITLNGTGDTVGVEPQLTCGAFNRSFPATLLNTLPSSNSADASYTMPVVCDLWLNSPARDQIPVVNSSCNNTGITTDQLGNLRPEGVNCDIGAVELAGDRLFKAVFEEQNWF